MSSPVTVPVVFRQMIDGWAAIIWPGPTGFGETPEKALAAARHTWPEAFDQAMKARGDSSWPVAHRMPIEREVCVCGHAEWKFDLIDYSGFEICTRCGLSR